MHSHARQAVAEGMSAEELASMLYDSLRTKLLGLPDETIVYPSAAILFGLADRHPGAALAPAPGTADRGMCCRRVFDKAEML